MRMGGRPMQRTCLIISASLVAWMALVSMAPAWSWGNEGHEIIALIGQNYLDPAVRTKVGALLAADTDDLTAHDIAAEATWTDEYRDSDRNDAKVRYNGTRDWHFVDIELHSPNLDQACFGHPAVPAATPASIGPARDCVVDSPYAARSLVAQRPRTCEALANQRQ